MSTRGRGRGGRGPLPRDVLVSKKMSKILRHSAEEEGLKLGPGGYVNVQDLLQSRTMKPLHATFAEIQSIVTSNDKQRFSLIPISEAPSDTPSAPPTTTTTTTDSDPASPSAYLIRANQGHSINSVASTDLLTPLDPSDLPALCVHGTTAAAWRRILASGGLKPMKRNHVHLAAGLPGGVRPLEGAETAEETQAPVISGMRSSSRVLIYVDLPRAVAAGVGFWRSANGVILTDGGEGGVLGVEFFERVEDRVEGVVLMREGKVVAEMEGEKGEKGGRRGGGGRKGGEGGEKGSEVAGEAA